VACQGGRNRAIPAHKSPLYPILCRWSPDGSQILFTAQRSPDPSRIYVIPAQGGTPRLLVSSDDGQYQSDGVWSPDGRSVLYNIQPKDSLRILDLDSGKVSEVPGSNGLFSPRWSPDGRYFAAIMTTGATDTVRVFDLQTQQWSTLVEHRRDWGHPMWSRDSKFLYALNYTLRNGPASWVYRIAVPGGTPERVVDLKDFRSTGANDVWFGLDPDDTPLLLRNNNGSNDIYALTLDSE
jgi:Tol biopolymer transport system component